MSAPTPLARLAGRLARRVAVERAQRRLVRDFGRLVREDRTPAGPATGPVVGVATFGSGCWHLAIELLLAHALLRRGARPQLLVCDLPELPICDERTVFSRDVDRCAGCLADKRPLLEQGGMPWRPLSAFSVPSAIAAARATVAALADDDLRAFLWRGWPVGSWLHVSGSHFLRADARGTSPAHVDARRRLLVSAIVVVDAVTRWLDEVRPDVVVAESGAHLEWRVTLELARARGIPVVCREMAKGGWDHHIYALDADAMSPDLDETWADARSCPLTAEEEAEVDRYVDDLPARTYDAGWSRDHPSGEALRARLRIPADARVAVAFTNVTWDLATAGRDVAFHGVMDWLEETIRVLDGQGAAHLVVRVHPAEASALTRERVVDQLAARWPGGLPHVSIVPPEDPAPAASLCAMADVVLAYNSTAAMEAAMAGVPVLVCGRPHFAGKGFTRDIGSRVEYQAELSAWARGSAIACPRDSAALARRYFHLFFLRYQLKLGWTTSPLGPPYRLIIKSMDQLRPGRNAALDTVCDGILHRRTILLPRGAKAGEAPCAR